MGDESRRDCWPTRNAAFCVLASADRDFGRWLTPDLLGGDITNPQSLNRYAYALNNPATLTDPLGLQANPCGTYNGVFTLCTTSTDTPGGTIYNNFEWDLLNFLGSYYGSSGGGGAPAPKAAPSGPLPSYWQVARNFNNCAANFADKHSVASLLNLNTNPVANVFLGSATAAASNLVFQTNPKAYVPAGASLAAGARAGAAIKAGAVAVGALPTGGTIYTYSGATVATPYGPALEMTPTGATVADTAVGSSLVSGAEQAASFLNRWVAPLVLWDEAMYGAGEAVCAASAF
jgi:hypothetical protein